MFWPTKLKIKLSLLSIVNPAKKIKSIFLVNLPKKAKFRAFPTKFRVKIFVYISTIFAILFFLAKRELKPERLLFFEINNAGFCVIKKERKNMSKLEI